MICRLEFQVNIPSSNLSKDNGEGFFFAEISLLYFGLFLHRFFKNLEPVINDRKMYTEKTCHC